MKRTFAFLLTGTALALLWASFATANDGQIKTVSFLKADVEAVTESSDCGYERCGYEFRFSIFFDCLKSPGCGYAMGNRSLWTTSVDALMLRRDGIDDVPLVVDSGSAADLYNAKDINFDFQAAPRVSIARRLSSRNDIEFEFFGLNNLTDNATVGAAGAELLMYGATFGNDPINLAFSSSLYSAELNWRRSWYGGRVKVLAGFRWLDLSDDLTVRDAFSPPSLFVGSVKNHLYGFQLGFEGTVLEWGRLEIETGFKGGIYGSTADVNAAFPQAGPGATFTADGSRTAFVGEVMVGLNYKLTDRLALRSGYQMLWIDGVALLTDQLDDLAVPLLGEAQMNGKPIYHGGHVGLQYNF